MLNKWLKYFRVFRPVLHFCLILFVFRVAYKTRVLWNSLWTFFNNTLRINRQELMIFAFISAIIFVIIWLIKNLYELNKTSWNYVKMLSVVRFYWFISVTFVSYFWQWFFLKFWISRYIILFSAFCILWILFLFDQLRYYLDFKLQKKSGKKILIITEEWVDKNSVVLDKIMWNFSFPIECVSSTEIENVEISEYAIAVIVWWFEKDLLQTVFEKTRFHDTRLFHVNEWYFLEDVVYKPEKLWNIIALEYTHSQLDWRSLVWKRIFDIVLSILWIICLSWLMIIIAIIIKLDSKWPVIYKSKRVWKGWNLFTFYKFRSMKTEMCVWYWWKKADEMYAKLIASDANNRKWVLPKIKDDPRVTKVWNFLRKTSLDELPQLFQVFVWSMSLVWPRPHLPNEVAQYENWERRVLSIKPWITWYAQVFWRDHLPFSEEAKLDLYYIQNWSLAMDLYVMFATVWVVFKWH